MATKQVKKINTAFHLPCEINKNGLICLWFAWLVNQVPRVSSTSKCPGTNKSPQNYPPPSNLSGGSCPPVRQHEWIN